MASREPGGVLLSLWKVVIGKMLDLLRPIGDTVLTENAARMKAYSGPAGKAAAIEYLGTRGIPESVVDGLEVGLVGEPLPGDERFEGWLSIPYFNCAGNVVGMRFRNLRPDADPRYSMRGGDHTTLFNLRATQGFGDMHVCEGEIDTMSLVACGLNAVGVPGVNNWKQRYAGLFDGCRVYVWGDGDTAGDGLYESVSENIIDCVRVPVPRGMDVNSVLVEKGRKFLLGLVHGGKE